MSSTDAPSISPNAPPRFPWNCSSSTSVRSTARWRSWALAPRCAPARKSRRWRSRPRPAAPTCRRSGATAEASSSSSISAIRRSAIIVRARRSAYSAKVGTGFANRIRARIMSRLRSLLYGAGQRRNEFGQNRDRNRLVGAALDEGRRVDEFVPGWRETENTGGDQSGPCLAVRSALHADRLPAAKRGILQHGRIDAAHRPHAGQNQRQFIADTAFPRFVEACRGRGDVGRQRDVLHAQHRVVVRRRLLLQNVERGQRDPAFLAGLDQRLFIHGRTAAGIDENGARLHLLEVLFSEHVVNLLARRRMHRYEIGLRQHLRQGSREYAMIGNQRLGNKGIIGHHPKPEGCGALGYGARHAPERYEAQCLPHQPRNLE